MKSAILFLSLALFGLAVTQDSKYCDKALCTGWDGVVSKHIGCPGVAVNSCAAGAQKIAMTADLKAFILDKHNSYRNTLAGGGVSGLSGAVQMPTLQWDDELQTLAEINVMQCNYNHDACRNTVNYKNAGQNLAWSQGESDLAAVTSSIDGWWNEFKSCTMDIINKYPTVKPAVTIGHFTQMAQDKANRIGCGAVTYNGNERVLACNYARSNLENQVVYTAGTTASQCSSKHPTYTNLCGDNEVIDVNKMIF